MKDIQHTCPDCGGHMEEVVTCGHCGETLEPVTFYMHHALKTELDWLIENRKQTGGEENLDEVVGRLIKLEVDKRRRIEEQKAAKRR